MTSPLYVVPNVVHFIWFADSASKQMTFINYVSVLSAHRVQKPDSIWFHCNHLPTGDWWERLWREVQSLHMLTVLTSVSSRVRPIHKTFFNLKVRHSHVVISESTESIFTINH